VPLTGLSCEQRDIVGLRQRLDGVHEVSGELLEVAGLDPLDTTEALKEDPKHADVLQSHDVATNAHSVNEGVLQGDVVGEPVG
jgi:hypothetical protein